MGACLIPTEAKKHWTSFTGAKGNKTYSFFRPHVTAELSSCLPNMQTHKHKCVFSTSSLIKTLRVCIGGVNDG